MKAMLVMDIFTPSPTPPLPIRRHPLLPPVQISGNTAELIPAPLFSQRKRLPSRVLHVTVHDLSFEPSSPPSDPPSSSTTSLLSSTSSGISSPPTSVPNSLSNRPRALTYSYAESEGVQWETGLEWRAHAESMPRRCLRRKPSPKKESLRSLRVKDSEACLQRVYDKRLEAYLNGDIFHVLGGIEE
jgi:hypothetical protein